MRSSRIHPIRFAPFSAEARVDLPTRPAQLGVLQLIHAYSYAWDSRDADATAALFTDDAVAEFHLNGDEDPTHRTEGREALARGMHARTRMLEKWGVETRHLMTNTVFDATSGNQVTAITTAMIYWQRRPDHPGPQPVQTGYYVSTCVNNEDRWQFNRRIAHLSGVFDPAECFSPLAET